MFLEVETKSVLSAVPFGRKIVSAPPIGTADRTLMV
jgi:hypothetical protein